MKESAPVTSSIAIVGDLADDLRRVVDLQIQLAKAELREVAISNAVAAACFGLAATLATIILLVVIPVILVVALPWHWQVAVIWGAIYLLAAAVLALVGRSRLRLGLPQKTMGALKEGKQWAIRLMTSSKS
ncbi:MAG: phage holin family protein [Candidatus Dormibacteraceae bacterium]